MYTKVNFMTPFIPRLTDFYTMSRVYTYVTNKNRVNIGNRNTRFAL